MPVQLQVMDLGLRAQSAASRRLFLPFIQLAFAVSFLKAAVLKSYLVVWLFVSIGKYLKFARRVSSQCLA